MNSVIFIMGVSGCGKSTIAKALSKKTNIPFFDGDDFHPDCNIKKMKSGTSLTDDDRWPWLEKINTHARQLNNDGIYACSALKQAYRKILSEGIENIIWIHLQGSQELIHKRVNARKKHFMPPELLKSQFDTLELSEEALRINIDQPIENIVEIISDHLNTKKKSIGIIGLGVMGSNIARNLGRNNISLALYNRQVLGLEENVANELIKQHTELQNASGFSELSEFAQELEKPRKIIIMVSAGAMDDVLAQLNPLLNHGDIIIDGGNSDYKLTNQRINFYKQAGINFIGMGISGGEKGALNGPAMMPGGAHGAFQQVEGVFSKVAAINSRGQSCVKFIGEEGSGHFVKTIHNGIEYAEMQLIAEYYQLMRHHLKMGNDEISACFEDWNKGSLQSYLLDITAKILSTKENNTHIVDTILDNASNKGTGAWASIAGIQQGVPFSIIASSLDARYTSASKESRLLIQKHFIEPLKSDTTLAIGELKNSYSLARILNHLQGFEIIKSASINNCWNINLSNLAEVWTGGCIIRSLLMFDFADRLRTNKSLIEDSHWLSIIKELLPPLKKVCSTALHEELPIPTLTSCLNYFLAMKQAESSANVIQAQRDYFGAHKYKQKSDPEGPSHHHNWE